LVISNSKEFKTDKNWNDWFAGFVDGDGCFYINKKNEISLEITTHSSDKPILDELESKLGGGTVKPRGKTNSVRYRVKKKAIIRDIVNRLNGKLRNSIRLEQFKKVCSLLEVELISAPLLLDTKSSYLAGFMDADGTIALSVCQPGVKNEVKGKKKKASVQERIDRAIHAGGHN
jgi:intein/homing endonuclease